MERKVGKSLGSGVIIRLQFQALINALEKKGIMSMEEFITEYDLLELEELQNMMKQHLKFNEITIMEENIKSPQAMAVASEDKKIQIAILLDGVEITRYSENRD